MKIVKLNESGYDESVLGFSLSYGSTIERTKEILPKYAFGKSGEGKFLESIILWWDILAPRYFWVEADTYRISTKQSASTIHTLKKSPLSQENFEHEISGFYIDYLNTMIKNNQPLVEIKNALPEGFLQRRIWMFSYKTLQNIYNQRHDHKLIEWHICIDHMLAQIERPEFIRQAQ